MKMYYSWGAEAPSIEEAYVIQIDSKEDLKQLNDMVCEEKIRLHDRLWGDEKVLVYDEDERRFRDMSPILKAMGVVAKNKGVIAV